MRELFSNSFITSGSGFLLCVRGLLGSSCFENVEEKGDLLEWWDGELKVTAIHVGFIRAGLIRLTA